nr:hypothetical protein [Tanacetum cinerariifolium]
ATPPKTKASVRSSFDTTVTPLTTVASTRLSTSVKGKQPAKASKAKTLTVLSEVAMTEAEHLKLATKKSMQQTHISQASGSGADEGTEDDDDVDEGSDDQDEGDEDDDQEEGNDDAQNSDEEGEEFILGNDEENLGLNVGREEGQDDEDDADELYRDVNINLEGRVVQMADVYTTQEFKDSHVTLTSVNPDGIDSIFETSSQMDVQDSTTVAPLPLSALTLTLSTISTTLEANFSEFVQTNQFAGAVSSILEIIQRYMDQRMNEAVKVAVQIQSDRLRDEAQAENEEFLKNLDENIQKIIKKQVKEHVKVRVSKILSKIEQTVNGQLKAEVLTRSSNSLKTSYAVAADLLEMELKKILIEKIEGNKSIHRSDEQRNLYKALVEAYESDKIILDTYGDTDTGKSTQGSKSRQTSASESTTTEEPMQTTHDLEEPSHPDFETGAADDQPIAETS